MFFARGQHADDDDADMVTEMLNCVGLVEEMPEHLMDAVTGLSGNGPAYVSITSSGLARGSQYPYPSFFRQKVQKMSSFKLETTHFYLICENKVPDFWTSHPPLGKKSNFGSPFQRILAVTLLFDLKHEYKEMP